MTADLIEFRALLRRDLTAFVQRCYHELNPTAPFLMNWHVELIANQLEAVRQGRVKRLIINIPPRHLKSLLASVALPAWCLGHDPAAQILCASYAQDLSDKLARDCRSVMTSGFYRTLFPATRLSPLRQAVQEFTTTANGFRLATSVGGVLTGRGADMVIIDDPLKPDEALSAARRTAVNDWFDGTLYSRLNDKKNGAIVIIMQRLHEDDLVGHVLGREPWTVVRLPAIAEADEEHVIETLGRSRLVRRTSGEALHPVREPLETLEALRQTLGAYNFAGQYQQAPAPLGGGLVKREWFVPHAAGSLPTFDRVVQSWDTANKATELADYSVCTTWGVVGKHAYLLHVLRRKMDYPDLKRAVRDQQQFYRADVVVIEDKASGTQLIQELVRDGVHAVQRYRPELDKVMRLHAQTATIENGFVHVPATAPWLEDYMAELTTFPRAKHDDQTDSTAQFLDWFKRASRVVYAQTGYYQTG